MLKDKEVKLLLPEKTNVEQWIVMGVDPSLTRTGMAFLHVHLKAANSTASWMSIGSIKPESSSSPVWARSKGIALYLKSLLTQVASSVEGESGLLLCMEAPTPHNDFLNSISKILHLVLLDVELQNRFSEVRVLLVNASTLRSLMGLTQRGNKNKAENIARAYEFIDRAQFPELDSDACDAVLLSMVGRHTVSVMLGLQDEVPANFLKTLCNAEQETRGSGRNMRVITKGILHRREYWSKYEPASMTMLAKDASNSKKSLIRSSVKV
jgi:hypothetical protein